MYTIEEFDNAKTKVLKYILYKKRTEKEILQKFKPIIEENLLNDVIQNLKEIGYINEELYIQRAIQEFMALKNLSLKEIKYKLLSKGVKAEEVEKYISQHEEELEEYEKKSAQNIVYKKFVGKEEAEIRLFLMKKGYKEENIKEAIENLEE